MAVSFATLADYVGKAEGLTASSFAEAYPGTCIVAMGVLNVTMEDGDGPKTMEMVTPFGRPKHDSSGAPALAGHVFTVTGGGAQVVSIGREESSDIMVPDGSVSSTHAELHLSDTEAKIRDVGSTNGTSVNNLPLATGGESNIEDGDLLTIGRYSFQYFRARTFFAAMKILV